MPSRASRLPPSRLPALAAASRLPALVAAALVCAGSLSACTDNSTDPTQPGPASLQVVASFYPLQYAVAQIGGPHVNVTNLTKPGAEPHDLELTPADVVTVARASLVVYEKGLQPAVDEAVEGQAKDHALDVAPSAGLDLKLGPSVGAGTANDSEAGATDPHFWLDPIRYAEVAKTIAAKVSTLDPQHRSQYARRLASFTAELTTLHREYKAGLASCTSRNLVTSHPAFGYLAGAYGLRQVGITGISPDAEPEPARLADVARYVRANKVRTIYAETLVSPAIAETVARETGARVAVLDPIEGLTEKSAGAGYFEVMRANLATLRTGQECS